MAIIFGVGFAALNTGNNLLYLVLALMLAFLVLSGVLSEGALRGLRVERRLPRELFARGDNRVVLHLSNAQSHFPAFAISAEDRFGEPDSPEIAGRCFALRIAPNGAADRSYLFNPDRRGDQRFLSCRLSTRFPFGLFVKSLDFNLEDKVVVYPELLPFPQESTSLRATTHVEENEGPGRSGDDLVGLREYVPGDRLSRVHWRSSLRSGKLIVGEREGMPCAEIDVQLELSPALCEREAEHRISAAATAIVDHLQAGRRVGLVTPTVRFPADSGTRHRNLLLGQLATETAP